MSDNGFKNAFTLINFFLANDIQCHKTHFMTKSHKITTGNAAYIQLGTPKMLLSQPLE